MNAVIIGRRRQGKSTLALWLAMHKGSVLIFDPNAQYEGAETTSDVTRVEQWVADGGRQVLVFRPSPSNVKDDFQALADAIWPYGNYSLIVDEASMLQRPQWMHPALERIVRQGPRTDSRNKVGQAVGVNVIQTAHRLVDIHSDGRSLWTDLFVFQTSMEADLKRLEFDFGPEVTTAVRSIRQRYHFLHWWLDAEGQPQWKVCREPELWYVDIQDAGAVRNRSSGIAA